MLPRVTINNTSVHTHIAGSSARLAREKARQILVVICPGPATSNRTTAHSGFLHYLVHLLIGRSAMPSPPCRAMECTAGTTPQNCSGQSGENNTHTRTHSKAECERPSGPNRLSPIGQDRERGRKRPHSAFGFEIMYKKYKKPNADLKTLERTGIDRPRGKRDVRGSTPHHRPD